MTISNALREYIAACIRHSHGVDHEALADAVWMLSKGAIASALLIGPDAARRDARYPVQPASGGGYFRLRFRGLLSGRDRGFHGFTLVRSTVTRDGGGTLRGRRLILAASSSPATLAARLFITGLASSSLAAAVGRRVAMPPPRVNTIINAGAGSGIILSVPVLLFLPGGWRAACLLFGGVALACLAPIAGYLPAAGVASAARWNFGPDLLHHHIGVDDNTTSLLWLISGGAGSLGH